MNAYAPISISSDSSSVSQLMFDPSTLSLADQTSDMSRPKHRYEFVSSNTRKRVRSTWPLSPVFHLADYLDFDVPSSTELGITHETLQIRLQEMFDEARYEVFEDGMESSFSQNLSHLLRFFGEVALDLISEIMVTKRATEEVISESLRWIGRIEQPHTNTIRRRLLEGFLLNSPSGRIRDGALLGIASLDDPHSLDSLHLALEKESVPGITDDIQQVISQLQDR